MPKKISKVYSHSRLSTFEQCQLRFRLRYIDKIKPEIEQTIEAHLGSAVHKTLEWLYREVIDKKIPKIDDIVTYYAIKWQESYSEETLIVKKELTQKHYFNKGVQFLINYYNKNYPFGDNTLEVEKRVIVRLKEGYKLQGYIDRLTHNQETGEYEIHDYKTGNSMPTQEKFNSDRQLALYSIAIKELFGEEKSICLIWHYLAHNRRILSRRTNEQLVELKKEILELIYKIESTTEFFPNKSALCDWCEYKTICPEFGGKFKSEKQKKLTDSEIAKEKLLDIW